MKINGAIDEVIELTRGEAAKNHISVTNFAQDLPLVGADRTLLQQVILNLITNAVHALSDGQVRRELLIRTSMDGSVGVLVSVQDSGKGTIPKQLERPFDTFYTTKPGCTEIGLSICRSIAESHGGKIWATADLPVGAAFHFTNTATFRRSESSDADVSRERASKCYRLDAPTGWIAPDDASFSVSATFL